MIPTGRFVIGIASSHRSFGYKHEVMMGFIFGVERTLQLPLMISIRRRAFGLASVVVVDVLFDFIVLNDFRICFGCLQLVFYDSVIVMGCTLSIQDCVSLMFTGWCSLQCCSLS